MAAFNTIAVYINGINLTRYLVLPIKWANLLDEQLDEGIISLRNCPIASIPPLTPVEIRINNKVILQRNKPPRHEETVTKYMIVSGQPNSTERPAGSGRYDHDLNIIEVTKVLERVVVDSITYTNVNGRLYTFVAKQVEPEITET